MEIYAQEEMEMEGRVEKIPAKVRRAPQRKVVILCGCSGAGKSTYIHNNLMGYETCSVDHYFTNSDGQYNFDVNKLGDAHAFCLKNYVKYLMFNEEGDVKVVVDNTNTTVAEVAPYATLALAYNCELEIVVFNTHYKIGAERNKHQVPLDVVRDQYNRIQKMKSELPSWWKVTYVNEKKKFERVKCTLQMLNSKKEIIEEHIEELKKIDLNKYNSEDIIVFTGAEKDYEYWALLSELAENDLEGLRDSLGKIIVNTQEEDELLNKLEEEGEVFFL